MSVKKILLFGMCGAGKDTQAEALSKALDIPVFSLGGLLREAVQVPGPFQAEIAQALEGGGLISPETAREILKQRLLDPIVQTRGYLLVGYPRNIPTLATYLAYETPTHGIFLDISREEALERSLKRGRKDDSPELIEKRIKRFFEEELSVWEELKNYPAVKTIQVEAGRDVDEVTQEILKSL